ncbi:MAG TPA: hypothetical protein PKK85_09030 [Methanobacteriaceae archaeon]|nr:hypothetical protein [Methanobacteriaceae archaeon]
MKGMEQLLQTNQRQKLIFGPNRCTVYNYTNIYRQVSDGEERVYAFIFSGDKDRKHDEGYYKLIQVRKLKRVLVTKVEEVPVSKIKGYSSSDWTMKQYRERYFDK